jgi:hypothetical protein
MGPTSTRTSDIDGAMTMNRISCKHLLVSLLMGAVAVTAVRADDSQTNLPIQVSGTPGRRGD